MALHVLKKKKKINIYLCSHYDNLKLSHLYPPSKITHQFHFFRYWFSSQPTRSLFHPPGSPWRIAHLPVKITGKKKYSFVYFCNKVGVTLHMKRHVIHPRRLETTSELSNTRSYFEMLDQKKTK